MPKHSAKFEVHGHRGARAIFPENTLEGFRYALGLGVDAIEIDVALTRDKVPVVVHDRALSAKLYRLKTPQGLRPLAEPTALIKDLLAQDLESLDIGSAPHPEFPQQQPVPGARVPLLTEFVELMMNDERKPTLNIEIKTHPILQTETLPAETFATAILDVLAQHHVPYERVLFQSFDPAAILAVKSLEPRWRASFLVDAWTDDLPSITQELGIEALSPRWDLLNHERAQALRATGRDIYVWTANKQADWEKLKSLGVNGIITDDPAACLAFRQSYVP
jgi:glycerophosphoryl diester phosphodiesterase